MELKYPVMITLRQIRDCDPCADGWKKVLAANGGVNADLDAEFELSSIIDSNDLDDCLWALQCRPEYQHLYRKFAVVCADEVKHLMGDGRSLNALDVAWAHSCGEATDAELGAAWDAALGAARGAAWGAARGAAWDAARDAALGAAWDAALGAARGAAWDAALGAAWDAALGAARGAAWDAARDAARGAALGAARDAARGAALGAALGLQANVLRHALTTGEVIRKCQKS